MQILWIATKDPLPASDGGRLVASATISALVDLGVEVTVLTPGDSPAGAPASWAESVAHAVVGGWRAALSASARRLPLSIARHHRPGLVDAVAAHLRDHHVDVVHVEQLQGWANAVPALVAGLPIVLRAHNVEGETWRAATGVTGAIRRLDAGRLRRFEARAIGQATATVALSDEDARVFRVMAPSAHVVHVPPPASPSASSVPRTLEGRPACLWIGSRGWALNEDGVAWLVGAVWPAIHARVAGAHLHVFGTPAPGLAAATAHPAPRDVAAAFDRDAILLLPLRHAAGVRMRILEAWARGVPVVASRAAARGLETRDGGNLIVADSPAAFADGVAAIAGSADLRARLVAGGRETLRAHHAPHDVGRQLIDVYRDAAIRAGCALPVPAPARII